MVQAPAGHRSTILKLIASAVLLGLAALLAVSFVRNEQRRSQPFGYFYDLSEGKLFVAPQTAVPPIRGTDNDELDGVRAVVISTSGNSTEQRIAYLEKCSPELKKQIETVQKAGPVADSVELKIGRGEAQTHILVRRVEESTWHPRNSPEGLKIVTAWQIPGPDGNLPVICIP
jgi:hypothetical protein